MFAMENKTNLLLSAGNISQLDIVQYLWFQLRLQFNPFWMATAVTTGYLIFLYTVLSLPWQIIYWLKPGFLWKYKMQDAKKKKQPTDWQCVKALLFNHVCVLFPLSFFNYGLLEGAGTQFDFPFPSWTSMLVRTFFYFVIEDAFFYFGHRWLHTEWAYTHIHALHHKYEAPIAMASSFAHPAEMIMLGIGSFLGPFIIGSFYGAHLFDWWVWMTIRQIEALDVHSGFDFPWHLSKLVPFYCGPHHHDHHHKTYSGNYSSTFTWMDRLCDTDRSYRNYYERKAKKAAAAVAGKTE